MRLIAYRYFMRILLLCALASVLFIQNAFAQERHGAFTQLLQRFVHQDDSGATFVDYAGWKDDDEARALLDLYIQDLASQNIAAIEGADAQFAAWANLYNALTIQVVLDNYPVASIRQIKSGLISNGPWKRKLVEVAGKSLSLDDIEHGVLREQWNDPRVHYAVNCASIGCPNLQAKAWEADTLNEDLNAAAYAYINHPRGVMILEDGALSLSSIYKWFREDFGGDDAGVLAHLAGYAGPQLAAQLEQNPVIEGYSYDWSLNDLKGLKQ